MLKSINPATEEHLTEFEEHGDKAIEEALEKAGLAAQNWRKAAIPVRSRHMKTAAEILQDEKQKYAALITREMGKPIKQAIAEVEKCSWVCEYYAENAKLFLKDEEMKTDAQKSYISYEPLGTILAIMPWNFPFWQVFRFAAPSLMAGNTAVLKHASNVPQCALAIEEIFKKAGFPEGVFQSLLIGSDKVEKIIKDDRIHGITLTGSESAGASVASQSGKEIKKTVLELGGSDPFIVLEDANLKKAAETAVRSRMQNTGQSCIAAKRFIVVKNIAERFINLLKDQIELLKTGDPMQEETEIGPLAREDLAEDVIQQVKKSIEKGAKIMVGQPERKKAFIAPILLANIEEGMPAFDEEVFGPVASVITAENEEEAIRIANNSRYGLGASLWTTDREKATKLARQIEAGNVFINSMVKSDPRLPFGGIKKSGFGRELSHFGMHEFLNIKTIYIEE